MARPRSYNVWFVDPEGRARRKRLHYKEDYHVWAHMAGNEVYALRHRKGRGWQVLDAPGMERAGMALKFPVVFEHEDKQSALAWAQMMAAMTEGVRP